MEHVYINKIGDHLDKKIRIKGWLFNRRSSGRVQFLILRDGTGFLQSVVVKQEVEAEVFQLARTLTQETSLVVTGVAKADARAPGGYELTISDLEPIQMADEYPITPKEHGVEFLMNHRHLWLRSRRQHAIMRIRNEIIKACRDFLDDSDFILIDAPILTPAACEGTTTLFETDFFDEKAYLSQSGQLYMEAAAMAFGKVYCFGPTFRAEKSKTRRHLMEFWMLEPEVAYANIEDNMRLQETLVSYVVQRVLERRTQELAVLERDLQALETIQAPFPRISYDEAIAVLHKQGIDITWGDDFGGDEETILAQQYDKPVLVHRFPAAIKAFYMAPDPNRPEVVLGNDLLAPEGYGEIIGGGERLADLGMLQTRMEEHQLPAEAYQWYLDLRRYGTVPHAGFGMGIERLVAWICGLKHVRETIPFPRMLNRMYP